MKFGIRACEADGYTLASRADEEKYDCDTSEKETKKVAACSNGMPARGSEAAA